MNTCQYLSHGQKNVRKILCTLKQEVCYSLPDILTILFLSSVSCRKKPTLQYFTVKVPKYRNWKISSKMSLSPIVLRLQPLAALLPIETWLENRLVANASVSFLKPVSRLSWDISSKTNSVFSHVAADLITDCVYTELAWLNSHPDSLVKKKWQMPLQSLGVMTC